MFKKKNKGKRKFDRFAEAEFVGIDSEGADMPDGKHRTILWMASDGEALENTRGLHSNDILEWLLNLGSKYRRWNGTRAIFVIYGGSYDFNMALRGIPEKAAREINEAAKRGRMGYTYFDCAGKRYGARMIARKFLTIVDLNEDGKIGRSITIYDVIGFFQSSFVHCIKSWLGKDYADLRIIIDGKKSRTDFNDWAMADVKRYTSAELKALVKIMDLFRDSLINLDLKIDKWHGAGALAGVLLSKYGCKETIGAQLPNYVDEAALYSYFGGRIELFRYGFINSPVYAYDINSAYPAEMRNLPDFSRGQWREVDCGMAPVALVYADIPDYSMVLIKWSHDKEQVLYPFAYRSGVQRKVMYPKSGFGWVHKSELDVAVKWQKITGVEIAVRQYRYFEPWEYSDSPCSWISAYYLQRQKIVAEIKRTGIDNGAEKVIKLGLNSLYGRTAQTVGGSKDKKPAFHNLYAAGYITAGTRAKLYDAAMNKPEAIIMAATDGLYLSEPLPDGAIKVGTDKKLGEWECGEYESGLFIQSGYYFLLKGGKWEPKTRGFDKLRGPDEAAAQVSQILDAYKKGALQTHFPCTRFITLGTACRGGDWFARWCSWYKMTGDGGEDGRRLRLHSYGTKREPIPREPRPHLGLIKTRAIENVTPDEMGDQYERGWGEDDTDEGQDIINDLDEFGYAD